MILDVFPLGVLQLELNDAITRSLVRAMSSVQGEWQPVVQVQAGTEDALRRFAARPDINTTEFCRSLLSSRYAFSDTLFSCALDDDLRASIVDLLQHRKEFRIRKENYVKNGDYEKAAICRGTQQEMTAQIFDRLAGKTVTISTECVTTAIGQMGWVETKT